MTDGLFSEPGAPEPPTAPVPPLRLRRVRLHGVGPELARFDPLDLDFATDGGAASRVLLSLTNTGGKSTLITLVCSVIVPASRAQVGGKVLGDYVLTGDTSHVVCEWEDGTNGERIVTGTVMEWRDGKRQPPHALRSTTNMHRAWYLFRTGPGLPGIEDLPFIAHDRRTPYGQFHAAVDDLIAGSAGTRGVITTKQAEWTAVLEERTSVDPTLFGYQMRMNDSEAGAQKLLESFTSANEVVRFFVAALNDPRELESFTGTLEKYAELAARRSELEALAAWGVESTPLIARIAACAAVAATATAEAEKARALGGELATALGNRIDQDRQTAEVLDDTLVGARATASAARRAYGQVSDIRAQLQLDQARADLVRATAVHERAELDATAAERHEEAWKAVDAVIDVQDCRTRLHAAQEAYTEADAGLGPLRLKVADAAVRLAGRLAGLITENEEAAIIAEEAAAVATALVSTEMTRATTAATRVSQTQADLDAIDNAVSEAATARDDAVSRRLLAVDEQPDVGVRRWTDTRVEATRAAAAANTEAEQADAAYRRANADITRLEPLLTDRHTEKKVATDRLTAFDDDVAALVADLTIHELHGSEPTDADAVERWIMLGGSAATTADATAAWHEVVAREARAELAYLDDNGTAPTGADVQIVLDALTDQRVWSVTGLSWIEHNIADADDRQAYIAAHPELAGGVVISDPSRFDAGVEALNAAPPRTRTPVTVTVAPESVRGADRADETPPFVVVPHRATWDRVWAKRHRGELATAEHEASTAATTATQAAARYRASSAACSEFVRRWGGTSRAKLVETIESATAAHTALADQVRAARDSRDTAYDLAGAKRKESDGGQKSASTAQRAVDQLEAVQRVVAAAEGEANRRPTVTGELTRALRDQEVAEEASRAAQQLSIVETAKAAKHRANLEPLQVELAGLGIEPTPPDPGGSVHVLRAAWKALRDELAGAESGLPEAGRLEAARTRFGEAKERLRPYSAGARADAEELAVTVEASTQTTRTDAVDRAMHASRRARSAELTAGNAVRQAREAVRAAEPADDHQNHFDLVGTEWKWSAVDEIPALLLRLETRNAELLEAQSAADSALREVEELRDEVAKDIDWFTGTVTMWAAERLANVDVYPGGRDTARTEMRARVQEQQATDLAAGAAEKELLAAVTTARAMANRSQWAQLRDPAVVRLRELPDPDLIGEAEQLGQRVLAMTESAADDLRDLDVHRGILRDSLQSLCRDQRRLLREVSRFSRLPAGLGDLSGKAAIKLLFEEAPEAESAVRLARRIDTWAVELDKDAKRARSAEVRARWLADAVRDTVVDRSRAGVWTIEILKPSIDGTVIYCPPDRIPVEFSGGQVLTLAVFVYCALSRVRAAHRQGGVRPPGTLILDNPFAAASAEALIAMQHRLAAHSGVQLVCATGLHDPAVDAAFTGPGSVIVKLRNDGDLRRNLSYLRLRAAVVDGVDVAERVRNGRSPDDTRNWVDVTRYEAGLR